MKAKTYLLLMDEIKKHKYGINSPYTIECLFEQYVNNEIFSLDDMYKDHHGFVDFVKNNIELFDYDSDREKRMISGLAYLDASSLMIVNSRFFKDVREEQEDFVRTVEDVVGRDKDCKILEVGSGYIPYSSMLLGTDGMDITSMDKFRISAENLKLFNVKSYRQLFDLGVDVSQYNIVVGRKPCSAIRSIVEKCKLQGTPYFLDLCQCESPNRKISGWRELLSIIDENVHFMGDYAYNLSLDGKQVNNSKIDRIITSNDGRYGDVYYAELDGDLI